MHHGKRYLQINEMKQTEILDQTKKEKFWAYNPVYETMKSYSPNKFLFIKLLKIELILNSNLHFTKKSPVVCNRYHTRLIHIVLTI